MPSEQPPPLAADRVSWNQLIAYGMGGLIPVALFNIAGQLMGLLGNISLGLSAFWLGVIMIIPRLWDAFIDPVIGYVSDNTRTRWGRRRPYILVGGIAVALSFVAMWWVPRGEWIRQIFISEAAYNWFQLCFILFGLLLFFTACTLFEIPHGALGMEISKDYHERTRLFSAKSFLGNLFAMGTPWLIFLAGMEVFRGPGGDLTEGMRYVSLFIAALLIPLTYWWFISLKEPGFDLMKERPKLKFWADMRTVVRNRPFLYLVGTIFTLAMGFNFVSLFSYYITIFYLYGGDAAGAGKVLGVAGTTWAITGLVAVFPLNWISRRIGKNRTLMLSIGIMCVAQVSKIFCYEPSLPYLVLIPTILLSMGMLMFFTLNSSMLADVCDDDELTSGSRREGSFYAVSWWFTKMGTAFASFVTGALLVYTQFDEKQNVQVEALLGRVSALSTAAENWYSEAEPIANRNEEFEREMQRLIAETDRLRQYFDDKAAKNLAHVEHDRDLLGQVVAVKAQVDALSSRRDQLVASPEQLRGQVNELSQMVGKLKTQAPATLFRLRLVEIGLPLLLSFVSMYFCWCYPLTEERCRQIKRELEARHASQLAEEANATDA